MALQSWNPSFYHHESENEARGRKRPCLEDRTLSSIQTCIHNLKEEIACLRKEISSMDQAISDIYKEISQSLNVMLPLERELIAIQQDMALCDQLLASVVEQEGSIWNNAQLLRSQLQESPRLLSTINPNDPPDLTRDKLIHYSTTLKQLWTEKEPQRQAQQDLIQRKYELVKQISDPCWEKKLILKTKRKLLEHYMG